MTYNAEKIIGNGSFGVVFKATIAETGETVAIKKVFQAAFGSLQKPLKDLLTSLLKAYNRFLKGL